MVCFFRPATDFEKYCLEQFTDDCFYSMPQHAAGFLVRLLLYDGAVLTADLIYEAKATKM